MDWFAQNWPMIVVIIGAAIAYGRHEARSSGMRRDLDELRARVAATELAHAALQRDLAVTMEGIKIQLARIETTLAEMRRSG